MVTMSPSSASFAGSQEASSTFDEFSMQQSLIFSDSLKDLKNLRSQLYSAAEYFEFSYTNDDQKQIVVDTLKDYAVKALVNTVDHLGSVSYKVNGLIDEKVDEVSGTEVRVSCIEQRLRTCQEYIDHQGLSQQSLVITAPKYHKRYILPGGKSMPGSQYQESNLSKEDSESLIFQAAIRSTIRDRPPSFRKHRSSSSQRSRSPSPSRKVRSPSPSPRPEKRAGSPLPTSNLNPLTRSGSLSSRPSVQSSTTTATTVRRFPTEPRKSVSMRLHAERDEQKDVEQNPSKGKRFLQALLSRRKSRRDDMLYTYLDEY